MAVGDVGDLEKAGQGLVVALLLTAQHVGRHIRRPEITGGLGGNLLYYPFWPENWAERPFEKA